MAIEVGALTLAVGVDKGTVIQQLRQIDSAVQRSAERGTRLNRLSANQYVSWWKDALRQRETEERRVEAEQKAATRRAATGYASWWKQALEEVESIRANHETLTANEWNARRRQAREYTSLWRTLLNERSAAEKTVESESSGYWMARRRHAKSYTSLWMQLLAEREAAEAAAERESAAYHMTKMRRARQLAMAENAAYREEARRNRPAPAARQPRPPKYPTVATPAFSTFGITGTLLGTLAVSELTRAANEMQVIQQRLMQVSKSGQEAAVAFDQLSAGAQKLRQPLAETAELYTKLRQSNANVQMSANETLKVTQAFSAALRISGATGQTAASAMLQFGQAMAKGKLDGDEFRTVAENASEVLRVLERNLGLSRAQLLKMREEGQLTSKMLADALLKDFDALTERATQLAPSLSQAGVALRNSMLMALTNTQSAREAIESFAKSIIKLADFVSENGPLLVNFGKLVIGITAAAGAFKILQAAHKAYVAYAATTLGPLALVAGAFTAVATAIAYANTKADERYAAQDREIAQAKTLYEANKIRERLIKEIVKQQQRVEKLRSGPVKQDILQMEEAELARKQALLKKVGEQMIALRDMAQKPVVSTADFVSAEEQSKNAAKALDEYISAVVKLMESGKATQQEMDRLNRILQKQKEIVDSAADPQARAAALDRVNQIMEVMRLLYATKEPIKDTAENVKLLADNFELLADYMTVDDVKSVIAYMQRLQEETSKLTVGTKEHLEAAKELAELRKKLIGYVDIKDGDPAKTELTAQQERAKQLREQMLEILRQAPEDVFVGFFDALGRQWADGSQKLGEQMRQIFGSILQQLGQNMIRQVFNNIGWKSIWESMKKGYAMLIVKMGGVTSFFGGLLTKLQTALANPLIAGPAMLAIGAAMVAYGAKMGAIGRGGGGGDLGGTIGGLNIGGGAQKPLIYTFGNQQNPFQGARSAAERAAGITVNATVIGPNDPQAQAQIAKLVDNAARRGLMNGSGMRTG